MSCYFVNRMYTDAESMRKENQMTWVKEHFIMNESVFVYCFLEFYVKNFVAFLESTLNKLSQVSFDLRHKVFEIYDMLFLYLIGAAYEKKWKNTNINDFLDVFLS